MLTYILRRLLIAIPTLFLVITLTFFLMRAAPGGPEGRPEAEGVYCVARLENGGRRRLRSVRLTKLRQVAGLNRS